MQLSRVIYSWVQDKEGCFIYPIEQNQSNYKNIKLELVMQLL